MTTHWERARNQYSYTVDLSNFPDADNYPDFFSLVITPKNRTELEERFRHAVDAENLNSETDNAEPWAVAGEVCLWKMYPMLRGRNRFIRSLLHHLSSGNNWPEFTESLRALAQNPSYERYLRLRIASGQLFGFVIPLTFLAFYEPSRYLGISGQTALWWTKNREMTGFKEGEGFSIDKSGNIQTTTESMNRRNWCAYESWTAFCRTYAILLTQKTDRNWQVSDVEAAVEVASRQDLTLEKI